MTNSELILLSLLAEKPRHGYEIEQKIEERGMRNWTDLAFSSIYFLLNKLVHEDLAVSNNQPAAGRGPAKKVFTITEAGLSALKQGVRDGLANPEPGSKDFMFGLSCLPLLPKTEAISALFSRKTALQKRFLELKNHPALNHPGFPMHVKAMFTYSIPLINAELNWLESFIQEVEKGDIENGKN
jgi:DNA-binding PadR family transcriptional regulator